MAFTSPHTTYTAELGETICERIASGDSLAQICREMNVKYARVWKWLKENPDFHDNYVQARIDQADADADKLSDIGNKILSGELGAAEGRSAAMVFMWTAGRRKPKQYGDRVHIDGIPGASTNVSVTVEEKIRRMKEAAQGGGEA